MIKDMATYCTRLQVMCAKYLKEYLKRAGADDVPGQKKKNTELMIYQFKIELRNDLWKGVGILLLKEQDLTMDKADHLVKLQESSLKMGQEKGSI